MNVLIICLEGHGADKYKMKLSFDYEPEEEEYPITLEAVVAQWIQHVMETESPDELEELEMI